MLLLKSSCSKWIRQEKWRRRPGSTPGLRSGRTKSCALQHSYHLYYVVVTLDQPYGIATYPGFCRAYLDFEDRSYGKSKGKGKGKSSRTWIAEIQHYWSTFLSLTFVYLVVYKFSLNYFYVYRTYSFGPTSPHRGWKTGAFFVPSSAKKKKNFPLADHRKPKATSLEFIGIVIEQWKKGPWLVRVFRG